MVLTSFSQQIGHRESSGTSTLGEILGGGGGGGGGGPLGMQPGHLTCVTTGVPSWYLHCSRSVIEAVIG